MGCLEKPIWTKYTREELNQIRIGAPDEEVRKKVLRNWDSIAKPLDGMGQFEGMTARIGAILKTENLELDRRAILIFCADNGIVAEGVSQSGQEVTALVAQNMAKGITSVGRMGAKIGVDTIPIDIGMAGSVKDERIIDRKIRTGTRNFRVEPAMTEKEALQSIAVGMQLVAEYKEKGYKILGMGEMGIGNTTTSSAVTAALTGCDVDFVTGHGAGLSEEGLERKKTVIRNALTKYQLPFKDPLTVLCTVGGLDIAGLVGMCIGGAVYEIPIVLDGVISMAAALVAERLKPGVREFLIPSHRGKEPAVEVLIKELKVTPVLAGELALGEGTGAVFLFGLLDLALEVYRSRVTFQESNIEQYERFSS